MSKRPKIMLVDDNPSNLTAGKDLLKDHYEVYPLSSAERLFEVLEKVTPDLILLDIEMPVMNGYETIKKLKYSGSWRHIPVIFLTAMSSEESELEGLKLGAVDYVFKPFSPPLLRKRIENHLLLESQRRALADYNENLQKKVQEKTRQVVGLQSSLLTAMSELVESRDSVTGGHIERTQAYLELLVARMWEKQIYWEEISVSRIDFFVASAPLHDVGKIAISDTILNKPGKLTPEEFEIMKMHTVFGEETLDSIMKMTSSTEFLENAKLFAGTHHEKWDGTGYPRGLKAENIPLPGRLMAIADVYDALIAVRPYKPAFSPEEAAKTILDGRGTHFDPVLTDVFGELSPQFAQIAATTGASNHAKPDTVQV
jgi:putative two-component system response regulator